MADELNADLNVNTDSALSAVAGLGGSIDDVLSTSAATFGDAMSVAVDAVSPSTIAVDADTTEADAQLAALDDAAAATVPVDADTTDAETQLSLFDDAAATGVTTTVDADISEAETQLQLFATEAATPVDIPVDADTTDAQASIDDLSDSASQASTSTASAASSTRDLGKASEAAAAGAGLATGSVSELGASAAGLEGNMGAAAGGSIALGAGVFTLFEHGVTATGGIQRFNTIVGQMADQVEHVNVGNLNSTLDQLAVKTGTNEVAFRNASATLFQFARNSGAGSDESAKFTNNIDALAARAVALNPALGSASDVAETMSSRLARGGRFAASFGVSLTAAEISSRALSDTGKQTAADLSLYEKSAAAAELATEKYGNSLDQTITRGSQNAIIQQRALGQEVEKVIEDLGRPLVTPIFDTLEAGVPFVESFGKVLADLAGAAIPLLEVALALLGPPLQAFAAGLDAIGPGALQLLTALGLLYVGFQNIDIILGVTASIMDVNPFILLAVGITTAIGALGLFGDQAAHADANITNFTKAVEDANGALDEHAAKALRAALEERHQLDDLNRGSVTFADYTDAIRSASGATENQIDKVKGLVAPLGAVDESNRKFIAALNEISPALGDVAARLQRHGELNEGLRQTIADQAGAMRDATGATKDLAAAGATDAQISEDQASATQRESDARQKATDALTAYKDALDRLLGIHLTLAEAEIKSADAQDKVVQAFLQGTDATHNDEQVQRERESALIDQTKAAEDLATATFDQVAQTYGTTAATQASDQVMHNFAVTLRDNLSAYGLTDDAIGAMLDKLGLTPFVAAPAAAAMGGYGATTGETAVAATQSATDIDAANMTIEASTVEHMSAAQRTAAEKSEQAKVDLFLNSLAGAQAWAQAFGDIPNSTAIAMANAVGAVNAGAGAVAAAAAAAGRGVGSALGSGIDEGIAGWSGEIAQKAVSIVVGAAAAANAAARSQSPSRLFAEIGSNMGAGWALGLENAGQDVVRAAEAIVHATASVPAATPPVGVGSDAGAVGRAFAAALPGGSGGSGVTVVLVRSLEEAAKYLPPDARNDPQFLTLGRT